MPYVESSCYTNNSLKYLIYLPQRYHMKEKWPIILFLHGAGERGNNIEDVKKYGIHSILSKRDIPFIVISPQCPANTIWEMHFETLNKLLEEVLENYHVDADRVYLTGISMGGYGAWNFSILYPDKFAAVVPVCGGAMHYWQAKNLKDTPVWAFHGEKDKSVPIEETKKVVKILEDCKGNIRFTIYPERGHEVCTLAYENSELFDWLLLQERK